MKADIYIFGNFGNGYSQYPDNYTQKFFKEVGDYRKTDSEIVYHREGALTYYAYTRTISKQDKTYIGLCYVFNDVLIKDTNALFTAFEDVITNIVVTGELVEFTDDGGLSSKVHQLYTNTKELQRISEYLNTKVSSLIRNVEKLPPINYAISQSEWKEYVYTEEEAIQASLLEYFNIRISKGENYNSTALTSYSGKLYVLNQEKNNALETVDKLNHEINVLKKKQKNFKLVIWLIVIICIGIAIFTGVINKRDNIITDLRRDIADKKERIEGLNTDIQSLNQEIQSQHFTINSLRIDKSRLTHVRDSVQQEYNQLWSDKRALEKSTQSTIKELEATIRSLRSASSSSNQGQRYEVYGKSTYYAKTYYKHPNGYMYETGVKFDDHTIVYLYYTSNGYGLTDKGFFKMEDIRRK
ncbi:MAG: hypothetical protein J6R26_00960 [Paludibacteraceae bacterium]|nr:hypothetical protein [Paludibacteraceae bacterium]